MTTTTTEKIPVYYPGHLGPEPTTVLRGGMRAVKWTPGRRVVELPRADAMDLIRLQGFLRAEELQACCTRLGLLEETVRSIARTWPQEPAKDATEYVLLERDTARALHEAIFELGPIPDDLGALKLEELKEIAGARGLDTSAKKKELVGQLTALAQRLPAPPTTAAGDDADEKE